VLAFTITERQLVLKEVLADLNLMMIFHGLYYNLIACSGPVIIYISIGEIRDTLQVKQATAISTRNKRHWWAG